MWLNVACSRLQDSEESGSRKLSENNCVGVVERRSSGACKHFFSIPDSSIPAPAWYTLWLVNCDSLFQLLLRQLFDTLKRESVFQVVAGVVGGANRLPILSSRHFFSFATSRLARFSRSSTLSESLAQAKLNEKSTWRWIKRNLIIRFLCHYLDYLNRS